METRRRSRVNHETSRNETCGARWPLEARERELNKQSTILCLEKVTLPILILIDTVTHFHIRLGIVNPI